MTIDPSLLSRVVYASSAPYNAPMNGTDDDQVAIQSALDDLTSEGGAVVVPGPCRLNGVSNLGLRARPNVSIVGLGPTKCVWDCRMPGGSIWANESLQGISIKGFEISHLNNLNADCLGIDFQGAANNLKIGGPGNDEMWFYVVAGVSIGAVKNAAVDSYQNQYWGRIRAATAAVMITGKGLQIGHTTAATAQAHTSEVRGVWDFFSIGVFCNGQGNRLHPTINYASDAGLLVYGNDGCFGNEVGPPAYFDSGVVGDKVRIENVADRAMVMLRVNRCPGLSSEADIVELATGGYAALKIYEGEIFVDAVPDSGTGAWAVGQVFTNRDRDTEAGGAGNKYTIDGWIMTGPADANSVQRRLLTGN